MQRKGGLYSGRRAPPLISHLQPREPSHWAVGGDSRSRRCQDGIHTHRSSHYPSTKKRSLDGVGGGRGDQARCTQYSTARNSDKPPRVHSTKHNHVAGWHPGTVHMRHSCRMRGKKRKARRARRTVAANRGCRLHFISPHVASSSEVCIQLGTMRIHLLAWCPSIILTRKG